MIITLTGNNSYGLQRRSRQLTSQFVKKYGELALERLDASQTTAVAILEAVQSLPFLATRKMVVVRDLAANVEAAVVVEQIIEAAGDDTDLVIIESNPDKRTAYYKLLAKKTKLESFDELDARALAGWSVDEAKNLGGRINLADANYLVERLGANQQLLANELAKLVLYQPQIDRAAIDLLTEPTPQSKIFDLLDSAFAGNKARTLALYKEQRALKVEPPEILAMLGWQLKALAVAKLGEGKSSAAIAADFGMNPFVINKSARLVRHMEMDKLKNLVNEALDMDYKSKTSALDLDEALKTYLVTI